MRHWLPRVALLLVGVALIAIGGLWYLASTIDLVALEAQLALAARERTGHDLKLEGIGLQPFPLPGLTLTGVELSAAPGFGPEPMLRVEQARARLRLRPLLRGELALGVVELQGVHVAFERTTSGRGSWETMVERLRSSRGDGPPASLPSVGVLRIRGAQLQLDDRVTDSSTSVRIQQLSVAPLSGPGTKELALKASLSRDTPAVEADVSLTASVALDDGRVDPAWLASVIQLRGEAVPSGSLDLRLASTLGFDPELGVLDLRGLELEAAGLHLSGSARYAEGEGGPTLDGRLELEAPELRGTLAALGRAPALTDPGALARGSASFGYAWDGATLRLEDIDARLDDTRARGALSLASLEPLALWFDLGLDQIDLDRYAGPDDDGSGSPLSPALRSAWVDGRLAVGTLRSGGLELSELELGLALQRGALVIDDAEALALGGSLRGAARADLVASPPRFDIQAEVQDLDLPGLVRASGSERDISGRLDLKLDLLASGAAREALLSSLDGRLCVAARDGAMPLARRQGASDVRQGERAWRARLAQERFELLRARLVEKASAKLEAQRPDRLDFRHMGACFDIDQGLARSDDVLVDAERLRLEGVGELDLPGAAIDMSCSLTLEGLPAMALRVQGSLDDPIVELDKPGAMDVVRHRMQQKRGALQAQAEQQREQLRDEVQERRQELRDDLREKSGEGVERLLDQREQALERRDEIRQQVQEARQGLRDQLRGSREALREQRRGEDEPEPADPAADEPEPEQPDADAPAPEESS